MPKKTFNRIRGSTPAIEAAARQLRKQSTPAEERLWQALRSRKLHGLRFRRQHPVGRFILDFFCPDYKLAIELDGSVHDEQVNYDAARSQELQTYGYHVIRFANQQVLTDLDTVLEVIYQTTLDLATEHQGEKVNSRPHPPQSPSPNLARGGKVDRLSELLE
ncbi:MAG: endonuclease domain-containing protein [Cyanobacteriota bacterium SKYGB_h_bin112]|nr:endonuclease domain-containing protein [Cyanobacteriota bacterium SKYGB_h_bin112]